MASGIITGSVSQKPEAYKYYIEWWEDDINIAKNTSVVHANLYITCYDHTAYKSDCYQELWIDGEKFTESIYVDLAPNITQLLLSGSKTVTHETDGTKKINIAGYSGLPNGNGYGPSSGDANEWVSLDTIPRYTTVYNSLRSKTVNSISIDWSTTDTSNYTQYSLNNESWLDANDTVASDHKSGYYTISGLSPNTQYTVKTRSRRADSGLWSESSALTITTYDIARISSAPNFEHGNNEIVGITNPGSISSLSLVMKIGDTQILSRTVIAGNNTITFSDTELDNIYKKYGSSSSLTATFTLSGSGYTNSKTCTITLKGNQKTARTNVSASWKRGKVWTNVSGTWKRGVIWTNVSGTWKRSI